MSKNSICYFAGGPTKIPDEVLLQASKDVISYGDTGVGVLEISHRSPAFSSILETAKDNIRSMLNVPATHRLLLMPGGGNGQFAAVPLNLMQRSGKADYIVTGTWSSNAAKEAAKYGKINRIVPDPKTGLLPDSLGTDPKAAYLFYCDNETIEGIELPFVPTPPPGVPLVCDMSSNICTRKIDFSKFDLVFAGAQKNLGCAGVTLVIIKETLIAGPRVANCPAILDYDVISSKNSVYNTPPVYAIHVLGLMVAWMKERGGIEFAEKQSKEKSELLYRAVDNSQGFYSNTVPKQYRSRVNVVFVIPAKSDGNGEKKSDERDAAMEAKFIKEAASENIKGIQGHRNVGGMRASLFNAISLPNTETLVGFMGRFRAKEASL